MSKYHPTYTLEKSNSGTSRKNKVFRLSKKKRKNLVAENLMSKKHQHQTF